MSERLILSRCFHGLSVPKRAVGILPGSLTIMKQLAKRMLYAVAPRWTTALMSARSRAHSHRVLESWGCGAANRKLIQHLGRAVLAGPFAGLELTPMVDAEQLGPFLLGTYECELDAAWAIALQGRYSLLVDVGAKFGYYAVGLARRYPEAEVVAFDTDEWARRALKEMAGANQTPNVRIEGYCDSQWFNSHFDNECPAFVISDCEGYEEVLFRETQPQKLVAATLIIETHEEFVPGVRSRIEERFSRSHRVASFGRATARRQPSVPLDFLSDAERTLAVQEARPPQDWLLCLPRSGPNRHLGT